MTKPQLVKVEALFYVLQQVIKRSCAYFDTAPFRCLYASLYVYLPKDARRAMYLPIMSNSILTCEPTPRRQKLVCSYV